jgi:hypothetical protein
MNEFELFKWSATAFITISAILVSFNIKWATEWWAYVGFLIGHIIWAAAAWYMEEWALLWLNGSFIFVDFYAIYIRLNKEIGDKNGSIFSKTNIR